MESNTSKDICSRENDTSQTGEPVNEAIQTEDVDCAALDLANRKIVMLQKQQDFQLPSFERDRLQTTSVKESPHESHFPAKKRINKNKEARCKGKQNADQLLWSSDPDRTKYCEKQERIDSFARCPNKQQQKHVNPLAQAGYYVTDNGTIRCFSCGEKLGEWSEQDNIWEWHARSNSTCLHIRAEGANYFIEEYLDIKSKKMQVFGERLEHVRLKEWLLCKSCGLENSNIVIRPCGHFCLCKECADKVTVCPTCGHLIIKRICAILSLKID